MAKSKTEVNFMEHLKPLLPAGGDASELEAAAQALAGLSPEDRDLLAAVQESPFRLTTLEQFREFPANTEYFILEPNIRKMEDVGWRYLAQHLDGLLPPDLLDAIDPVPFGNHAMQEVDVNDVTHLQIHISNDDKNPLIDVTNKAWFDANNSFVH